MPQFKVRDGFHVHHNYVVHDPGSVIELTEAEAADYAHQVEPVEQPKATRKSVKADDAQ